MENAYDRTPAEELPWGQMGLAGVFTPANFQQFDIFADFVHSTGVQMLPPICKWNLSFDSPGMLEAHFDWGGEGGRGMGHSDAHII